MTDEEWSEIYKRTEKRMKKICKIVLGISAAFFITVGLLWGSFIYVTEYKITDVSSTVSPDGVYELVLQAVGEAVWPFGQAKGRLVLKENQKRVSRKVFTVYDDGGNIRDSLWAVKWYEDYVEVMISGSEQADEQILLYYDGREEVDSLAYRVDGAGQEDMQIGDNRDPETTDSNTTVDAELDFRESGKVNSTELNQGNSGSDVLPQPYAKYMEVLEQILTGHTDPNGRVYDADKNMDFGRNAFAIADVDGDGKPELLFSFGTSNMAGMCEVVYGYDEESDTVKEELAEWVDNTYYSNGLVKASASHNHGKDPEGRGIWPYTLYQYDADTDSYQLKYSVDSWDGQINSENFPEELDADGDGVLYCIVEDGKTMGDDDVKIVDREAYDNWVEATIPEWNEIDVVYYFMTAASVRQIQTKLLESFVGSR